MNATTSYVLSKKYTSDTAASLGSLKGAPCTVGNVTTDIAGNTVVELKWENNSGVSQTMNVTIAKGVDGLYVTAATVDVNNHLILKLSDSSTIDAGEMPQAKVEISKDTGNAIENKADGLYVTKTGVTISPDSNNALREKTNGLYVPETDLKDYAKTADVVEKEIGKGLSTNDFTNSLKTKLDNLPDDAQKNVQPDWNESNPTSDAFILNKPTIPDGVSISKDADNQLVEGSDKGLFVAKCPVDNALSTTSENPVQNKIVAAAIDNKVEKETGKGLSTNDYDNTEKAEVAKVKNKLDTASLTDQSLKKIHLYDDFEIVSNGTDLPRLHWSDGEVIFGGDNVQIHSVAGEESRVTVGDGILKLEGSPYNTKNATLELGLDGNYKSYINIDADDVTINGNPLNASPEIFHVVGLADKGVTPGGTGHSVTAKELWDAGVRAGTYIIFCHSNTSTSQKFFMGFVDMWLDGSDNPSINDATIISVNDNTSHMRYGTYDGEERLYYIGGDEGTYCSMDFIKFSSYVDN